LTHAVIAAFLIPSLLAGSGSGFGAYGRLFELLMALCGAFSMGLGALVLARQRPSTPRLIVRVAFAALMPLLIGSVIRSRYDLWPAALTMASIAAIVYARERIALAMGLTQIWIPELFWQLTRFETVPSWAVLGRDLVLLALLATVAWPDLPIRRSLPIAQRQLETASTATGL
jgi:hypothetical protein